MLLLIVGTPTNINSLCVARRCALSQMCIRMLVYVVVCRRERVRVGSG